MTQFTSGKSDIPILILSVVALLLAGVLSMVTMANRPDKIEANLSSSSYHAAEEAAEAGIQAAKWHIQCHGRKRAGGLDSKYHINGATYKVAWDDIDLTDSTVVIHSEGESVMPSDQRYTYKLDSKIKIEFLPAHSDDILTSYYDENSGRKIVAR